MKKFAALFVAVLVVAGCSIFGSDGSDRFGAWEKVSSDRGEYRGVESQGKIKAVTPSTMADTVEVDTLFVDNTNRLSMSIEPVTHNNNYTFRLAVTDSARKFFYTKTTAKYVTDSTAIAFQISNGFENKGRNEVGGVSKMNLWFTNKCKGVQDEDEYVILDVFGKNDSSRYGRKETFKVYVNGMKDIASDIVQECKG